MKNKTKKATVAAAIFAAALGLGAGKANAQVNGNIEAIFAKDKANSFLRGNFFYGLPWKIEGYTFMELHTENKGYFGKTFFGKEVVKNLSAKAEARHINEPFSMVGLGAEYNVPMPKGTALQLKALPLFIDKNGHIMEHQSTIGYVANAELGKGWSIGAFGDINIGAEKGPAFEYGENYVQKYAWDGVSLKFCVGLIGAGNLAPKPDYRLIVNARF